MPATKRRARGNNGNHRPMSPQGLHDLGMLDLAEAAAEHKAAMRAFAHAFRRCNDTGAHLTRAYTRIATAWAREHGSDDEPTSLGEIIAFPMDRAAA